MSEKIFNSKVDDETVVNTLKDCGALLQGHFLLSSGRHSDFYFQCARLFMHPDRAEKVMEALAAKIRDDREGTGIIVDSVCGPALGGIISAYELGRQLGVNAFFTERDDTGVMTLRRGFAVAPGERVLIAEDVVTTGKSSAEAREAVEKAGGRVVGIACVVDRRSGDEGITVPLYSACKVSAANYDSARCPLCKTGLPAVKPGSRKIP